MIQKGIAIFAAILFGGFARPATADTCFTNRPASSNYTYAVDEGTWCGKGLVERRLALDNPLTILPACDSQQHFLQTWKPITKGIIPSYVDLGAATGGVFDAWFSSHPLSNDFPKLAVTGLLIRCGLPVNYFDVAPPWRPGSDISNGWPAARTLLTNLAATAKTSATITNGIRTFADSSSNSYYRSERTIETLDVPDGCTPDHGGSDTGDHPVGQYVELCSQANSLSTTGITSYGQSVSYDYACTDDDIYEYSYASSVGWGDQSGGGFCCYVRHTTWTYFERSSSKSFDYNSFSGNARCPAQSNLSAWVDFYEKITSSGPTAQTDTWTYAVDDGAETYCESTTCPMVLLNTVQGTSAVIIARNIGIQTSGWHRVQAGVEKSPGNAYVLVPIEYPVPAELLNAGPYESGSCSLHQSGIQYCDDYCNNNSLTRTYDRTYVRRVKIWNGYTPQTPRYLFLWNFNYN